MFAVPDPLTAAPGIVRLRCMSNQPVETEDRKSADSAPSYRGDGNATDVDQVTLAELLATWAPVDSDVEDAPPQTRPPL